MDNTRCIKALSARHIVMIWLEGNIVNDLINYLRTFLCSFLQIASVKQEVQQPSGMIQFLYNLTNDMIYGKIN
jgi:hypothetical protein